MIDKNFLRYVIWVMLIFPSIGYSQFCPNAVVPPITINSINVTATSTGSVSTYPLPYTSCGMYTTPANSIYIGQIGAFTYTMNFSSPLNNLDFVLTGTGDITNEVFTFTTNTGIPSIIDQGSCFSTITGNVLSSGSGSSAANGGGGGYFTLVNATPFTSLTISGEGGRNGSLLAICSSSIVIPADTTIEICNGDSVLIGGSYQKVSGLYSDGIITTNLIVNSIPPVDLGSDIAICAGETLMLDATTSSATYLWQDNSTNPTFNVSQQGTYWTEVTLNNCTNSDTVIITNYSPLANVDLGNDTTICLGETLTLDATTPNVTYLWQDNSTNPTFHVTHQGTYWVQITDNCESTSDSILINEKKCEIILEIPNVFTPYNNDGVNDLFVPIISKGIVSMNTIIFNRWGSKVFETKNLMIEWNGQDVSYGTYFWIVYYTDVIGVEDSLRGYVTIFK